MIFILSILISVSANAQGLNAELGFNDNYNQYSKGIVCVNEYSYFAKRQHIANSFFTTCSILKMDTLENIVWELPVNPTFAETYDITEMIPSENGGVYIMGSGIPTCDLGSECFWFVQKINENGFVEWTNTWENPNCFEVELNGLSLDISNELLINHTNDQTSKIYRLSNTGLLMDSLEIVSDELNFIQSSPSFEYITFKQDSLIGFNNAGAIQSFTFFSNPISGIVTVNDTIYVLTSDSLFSFEPDFTLISSNSFIGYSEYSNLHFLLGQLAFISSTFSSQEIITVDLNLQLIGVQTISTTLGTTDPKDFNELHFVSSSNFDLRMFQSVRYLDYSLNSPLNTTVNTTDIGIVDIKPTQIDVVANQQTQGVYEINIYADVLVKNYGSNDLNECRINHYISQSIACGHYVYTEMFDNLSIAPGDSAWVSLGLMHWEQNYFPNDTIIKNLCVYTSHPNYKTDLFVSNDELCKDVLIGYVQLDEINLPKKHLLRIVNLMGEETVEKSNIFQIYIYSDGTTEKVFKVD